MGEPDNINQAHVPLAALDSTYICPVEVSPFRQGLLRKPHRKPPLPDGLAELNTRIRGHALIFTGTNTMLLETISIILATKWLPHRNAP